MIRSLCPGYPEVLKNFHAFFDDVHFRQVQLYTNSGGAVSDNSSLIHCSKFLGSALCLAPSFEKKS